MRVEDCIVAVERRTAGQNFDLACMLLRHHRAPVFQLWLLNAIPSCVLVWLYARYNTDSLIPSLLIFLLFCSAFNAQLVAGLGPLVFGESFSPRRSIQRWRKRLWGWMFLTLVIRTGQILASFVLLFPALMVTAQSGHLNEVLLLEQSPLKKSFSRLSWLTQAGGYGRNMGSLITLAMFWLGLSGGIFLIIDLLVSTLLNYPLFLGRMFSESGDSAAGASSILIDSPEFLTLLQVSLWAGWPLIRIAWFFCYLDQRIRSECWDLQVQFRAEAVRLEGATV